ncbi:NAD-dependent protein deacetylase sirtuin-2 [Smittium mucronatum]|uniref:NAD-dependent protein deacetylase sirtuin-2 n=1 Tax=Smittium mucronatum TaxID=133383 RepID=A0A1R0H9I7_9FUNG|nr:NAD-dependent protein deacetylase sirtuin-2 [Smittium mucronatum]
MQPTISHYFIKLLADKKLLKRTYTQNVDMLERLAGIDPELVVEAHGSFITAHCINPKCKTEYSLDWVRNKISANDSKSEIDSSNDIKINNSATKSDSKDSTTVTKDKADDSSCKILDSKYKQDVVVPLCEVCSSYVKPDIVFFGEQLPDRFYKLSSKDFRACDLVLVMGTSLKVYPFAGLVDLARKSTRYLINNEVVGYKDQFKFVNEPKVSQNTQPKDKHSFKTPKHSDYLYLGNCDDGCMDLATALGWKPELDKLYSSHL